MDRRIMTKKSITIELEVWEMLKMCRCSGESFSDVITRLMVGNVILEDVAHFCSQRVNGDMSVEETLRNVMGAIEQLWD